MNCPNCKKPFTQESEPNYLCPDCGWLTKKDDVFTALENPPAVPEQKPNIPEEVKVVPVKPVEVKPVAVTKKPGVLNLGILKINIYD